MPETDVAAKAEAEAKAKAAAKAKDDAEDDADGEDEKPQRQPMSAASRQAAKKAAARLFTAFRSNEVGLGDISASVLAAHCLTTKEKAHQMGATEAIAWAKTFKQQYPMVWGALRIGHMINFAAAARRSEMRTCPIPDLEELAGAIRA